MSEIKNNTPQPTDHIADASKMVQKQVAGHEELVKPLQELSKMSADWWNTRNNGEKIEILSKKIFDDLPKLVNELTKKLSAVTSQQNDEFEELLKENFKLKDYIAPFLNLKPFHGTGNKQQIIWAGNQEEANSVRLGQSIYKIFDQAFKQALSAPSSIEAPQRFPASCSAIYHKWTLEELQKGDDAKTTLLPCLLCDDPAAVIVYAPNGCTCSPNKIQPRCQHHLNRALDSNEDIEIIEDFRLPQPPKNQDKD